MRFSRVELESLEFDYFFSDGANYSKKEIILLDEKKKFL